MFINFYTPFTSSTLLTLKSSRIGITDSVLSNSKLGGRPPRYIIFYSYKASRIYKQNISSSGGGGTVFFLHNDLHSGKTMTLLFSDTRTNARFLPRQVSDSVPFSSDKLPEILNRFSVKPKTTEAGTIRNVLEDCEIPKIKGEDKYCAVSLESLVDFVTSKLGHRVKVISTEIKTKTKLQKYEILEGIKMIGEKQVVCHKLGYAYAVFMCHTIDPTQAYMVPLMGSDGSKVEGVAVCHMDSSDWSPEHYAFQQLRVKPGASICHFLNIAVLVWLQN
ncbi:BURP domain-containing protein 3-like [Mercurialis annua]|uniref:BURP domain-containing protein 3-like n=1 Tax=Mercurialis annua TaxID=3986 RepID=UPI00215F0D28|nr:BURP domain-containing protein 3-like [Mercurialis annua]